MSDRMMSALAQYFLGSDLHVLVPAHIATVCVQSRFPTKRSSLVPRLLSGTCSAIS